MKSLCETSLSLFLSLSFCFLSIFLLFHFHRIASPREDLSEKEQVRPSAESLKGILSGESTSLTLTLKETFLRSLQKVATVGVVKRFAN